MSPSLLLLLLAAEPIAPDTEPPIIEDLAAAASNPDAAPVITVMLADAGTGVANAHVFFRALAGDGRWQKAELKGGTSGLFIARLPDGLQKSGFDYYVEAVDVAGNGPTRIGSPEAPIRIERATESTLARIAHERPLDEAQAPPPQIHPAWMMLSLGVGLVAGAGAGAYGLDLIGTNKGIDQENGLIASTNISDKTRQAALDRKTSLETAATQDTVIALSLGVVAAAGLVTGVALVGIASAAQ